tara:strand:+ start:76 stop:354 length:279 start_codon:yes stop_codon:yes gene_type:complete
LDSNQQPSGGHHVPSKLTMFMLDQTHKFLHMGSRISNVLELLHDVKLINTDNLPESIRYFARSTQTAILTPGVCNDINELKKYVASFLAFQQ